MRASRLLQILLLLQNRGRMTATMLARELEVSHRTILRDMDALTEAGLPVIGFQGNQGGFALAFDYRTRLTGLDADEAEALAIILDAPTPHLTALGLASAGRRAIGKVRESYPDPVRRKMQEASRRFPVAAPLSDDADARVPALAGAVRNRQQVRLRAQSAMPRLIHPVALAFVEDDWRVVDARSGDRVPRADWHDINISSRSF